MKPGEVVAGRFRVLALAGRGGMGTVYRALDLSSDRPVALKIVHLGTAASRSRFELEARALAELTHPNIVPYVWHGVDGSRGVVAMAWLGGRDLAHVLHEGPLSVRASLEVLLGLSRALAEAHARGVVHRDVKPSNVLIVGDASPPKARDVRLLDFGLASLRPTGELQPAAGTARYMAPEQARGDAIDPRADCYALGCVLFECLTGKPAFDSDRTLAVLTGTDLDAPPMARARQPEVPLEVDALVARLLAQDPEDRPADGRAVATAIASLVGRRTPPAVRLVERWVPALFVHDPSGPVPADAAPVGEGRYAFLLAFTSVTDGARAGLDRARAIASARPDAALHLALTRVPERPPPDFLTQAAARALDDLPPGRVLVAEDLARLVSAGDPRALERAAGRLWLTGVSAAAPGVSDEGSGSSAPEVVGRDAELRLVQGTFAQCEMERLGRTVGVWGPPGIGVSAFARAALDRGAPTDAWSRWSVAAPRDRPEPFAALRVLVAAVVSEDRLEDLLPSHELALARDALAALSGAASPEVAGVMHDPARHAGLLERGLLALLSRRTAGRPAAILLDDAHLVDGPSRGVLEAVRRATAGPFTWILAGRPETEAVWSDTFRDEEALVVRIGPLRTRAAERLAQSLLPEGAPLDLARSVASRAEGHPLVICELARSGGAEIPATVQAIVQARLASLSKVARGALCAAAILGDGADVASLAAALEAATDQVELALDDLRRSRLLEADVREGASGLRIPQALVREVATAQLPERERAALLGRVAAMPGLDEARAADLAERAGLALAATGEPDRATAELARAVHSFTAGSSPSGAARAGRAALELGRPDALLPEQALALLENLASALTLTRRAYPDLAERAAPWLARVAPEERPRARVAVARALGAMGKVGAALAELDALRAVTPAGPLLDAVLRATVEVGVMGGDFAAAVRAADDLEARGAERPLATLLRESNARAAARDHEGALRALERARAITPEEDLAAVAEIGKYEALAHLFARDFPRAVAAASEAADLARRAGLPSQEAANLHNLGDALHRTGRFDEARSVLERSVRLARASGHTVMIAQNELHLAYLDARAGSADAEALLRAGVATCEAEQRWGHAVDARVLLVRLAAARSREEAEPEAAALRSLALEKGQLLAVSDLEELGFVG